MEYPDHLRDSIEPLFDIIGADFISTHGPSPSQIVLPTIVNAILNPDFPHNINENSDLITALDDTQAFTLSYLLTYAQTAVAVADNSSFDPLSQTELTPQPFGTIVTQATQTLSEEFGLTRRIDKQAFLLQWALPITAALEYYAKIAISDSPKPIPSHITHLAKQGLYFWSPMIKDCILEELSGRISDASYAVLYPEEYKNDWERHLQTLFNAADITPELRAMSPHDLQVALCSDQTVNGIPGFMHVIQNLVETHIDAFVTRQMLLTFVERVSPESISAEGHKKNLAMLIDRLKTYNVPFGSVVSELEHIGIDPSDLLPKIRLRLKSVYRTRLKRNAGMGQDSSVKFTNEDPPRTKLEEIEDMISRVPDPRRRARLVKGFPYFEGDVLGVRVVLYHQPSEPQAMSIREALLAPQSGLRRLIEVDARRVELPPDVQWPAIHCAVIAEPEIHLPGIKRSIKLTGPIEIQFTGKSTVQQSPSRAERAAVRIRVFDSSGDPVEEITAAHAHTLLLELVPAMASAFSPSILDFLGARLPYLKQDFIRLMNRISRGLPPRASDRWIPLDTVMPPGIYEIVLADPATCGLPQPSSTDIRYDVLRAIPHLTPESRLLFVDSILRDMNLGTLNLLYEIIRAHDGILPNPAILSDEEHRLRFFKALALQLIDRSDREQGSYSQIKHILNAFLMGTERTYPRKGLNDLVTTIVNGFIYQGLSGYELAEASTAASPAIGKIATLRQKPKRQNRKKQ